MAVGALKAVADAGLRVPDDFSVVGFDDIDLARFFCPALTTMRQPIDAMSEHVLSLMLELIDDPQLQREKTLIRIPPVLVVRQSTGPGRRGNAAMKTSDFAAGCGEADITPPPGIPLSGFIFRENKPSVGVDDPLSVRVLAVRQDGPLLFADQL